MPFDIYGHRLRDNYCEVHPDVPEPYPCSTCHEEHQRQQHEEELRRDWEREQEARRWDEQRKEEQRLIDAAREVEG